MTSSLDRTEARDEAVRAMVLPGIGAGRGVRRGELDRAGGQDAQLDAHHLGRLAAGGCRRILARCRPPLPTGAQRLHRMAMKNLVRELRTERNLAQGQLAEAMGVSRQTINSIETERYTPSLPLAMALARFFGVTVEEMFDDHGS